MLKKISSSVKTLSTRILIVLIALSFALWGIGDIFNGSSNPTIATVGKTKIKLNTFNIEYQSIINNLRQSSNEPLTDDFVKAMGLHKTVLNNMINQTYLNMLSKDLGITVSNKYIKKSILKNSMFQDDLGVFSKGYFDYFINRNNLSEQDLVEMNKNGLINDIFLKSLNFDNYVPKLMYENIEKKRNLARKAEVYQIDTTANIINKKITDEQINKKYQEVKTTLLKPEKRDINIIVINKSLIKDTINITDENLMDIYQSNIDMYIEPEKRQLYQFIRKDKKSATEISKKINNKKSFNAYVKNNNINLKEIELGEFIRGELEPKVEKEVFSLQANNVTSPIKTAFGWKVFYLNKISSGKKLEFNQVKNKIKKEFLEDAISQKIYEIADKFYEKFLETNDLELSLTQAKLKSTKYTDISINDINKLKSSSNINLEDNILIKNIFNLKQNNISDPVEYEKNSLIFFHINKINQAKAKSLSEAKKEVLDLIYNDLKLKEAKDNSVILLEALRKNKNFDKSKYALIKTNWLTNDNRIDKNISLKIKNIIFSTPLNNYSNINQVDNFKFVIVRPIKQNVSVINEEKKIDITNLKNQLNTNIDGDLINALIQDIKLDKKSSINQSFINSF